MQYQAFRTTTTKDNEKWEERLASFIIPNSAKKERPSKVVTSDMKSVDSDLSLLLFDDFNSKLPPKT